MARRAWRVTIAALALAVAPLGGCGNRWEEEKPPPPPTAPASPYLVASFHGDAMVRLDWQVVTGATSYRVYLATVPGVTKENWATLPGGARRVADAPPYDVAPLVNGTNYRFVVTAVDDATGLESVESNEVQGTPNPLPNPANTFPETGPATVTLSTSATLTGAFTVPPGYPTSAWFEYGPTTTYGTSTAPEEHAVEGAVSISAMLVGLPPEATFHYRLVTQNDGGLFVGADATFTTLAEPEVVLTDLDAPCGLPTDGTWLYLFEIYRGQASRLDLGTLAFQPLATEPWAGNSCSIAIDSTHAWFYDGLGTHRMELDGANLVDFTSVTWVTAILPNETAVFLRDETHLLRASLDGSTVTTIYTRVPLYAEGFGGGLAADAEFLYWSDYYKGTVQRMPLAGGEPVTLVEGLSHPQQLLLDGGTLFIAGEGAIWSMPADGAGVSVLATVGGFIAKEGALLYGVNSQELFRVDLASGTRVPLARFTLPSYGWVGDPPVLTADHVYWLTGGSHYYPPMGTLSRIPKR